MAGGDQHGYLKTSRKQFRPTEDGGCPWWNKPRKFSEWEAWVDLIQSAAWSPHQKVVAGKLVSMERGETPPRSIRYLALRWGWSMKLVRNFLAMAEEMDRIRARQCTPKGHTYLVVNYDTYQGDGHSQGTEEGTARAQPGHSQGTKKKKSKKSKKREEGKDTRAIPRVVTEAIPGFEELWAERMQSANEKRRKITPTGERQQLARIVKWLEAGTPPSDIRELIEDATAGSWQGLKLEWLHRSNGARQSSRPGTGTHGTGSTPELREQARRGQQEIEGMDQ